MKKGLFERILLAVDGSDEAILASKLAIMLAKRMEASLTALYIVDTATIKELLLSRIFIDEESKEYETSLEENGKKYLHFVDELAVSKKLKIETVLERGSIYGKILEVGMEKRADLIVVGGRKRGAKQGESRDLLTSEYARVLKEAQIPVLFAKGDEIEQSFSKL